jgi:hypothetical protein
MGRIPLRNATDKVVIRKFEDSDHGLVAALWQIVFPNDPRRNEPSELIHRKRTIHAGYDGGRGVDLSSRRPQKTKEFASCSSVISVPLNLRLKTLSMHHTPTLFPSQSVKEALDSPD